MINWLLFIVIVIYNILDSWQTVLLLRLGAKEMNPMIQFSIDFFGSYAGIYIAKAFPLTLLAIGIYLHQNKKGVL